MNRNKELVKLLEEKHKRIKLKDYENDFTSFATDIETVSHKSHPDLFKEKANEHDTVST